MAYSGHIERPDGSGITLAEWETYVAGDAELSMQREARATSPEGESIVVPTPHAAAWRGWWGAKALFSWHKGAIHFDRPTSSSIAKAKRIALVLRAHVVGDEGEAL